MGDSPHEVQKGFVFFFACECVHPQRDLVKEAQRHNGQQHADRQYEGHHINDGQHRVLGSVDVTFVGGGRLLIRVPERVGHFIVV